MKLHVLYFLRCLMMVFVLVGCGGVGESTEPNSLLILTPLPTNVFEGDCDDVAVLENWIQTIVFNQIEFINFLQSAQEKSRTQLFRDLIHLNALAYTVANIPALSCGVEAYTRTRSAMENTLIMLQAYVNAERQDLEVIITLAQRQFEDVKPLQDELLALLDRLYQNQATTTIP